MRRSSNSHILFKGKSQPFHKDSAAFFGQPHRSATPWHHRAAKITDPNPAIIRVRQQAAQVGCALVPSSGKNNRPKSGHSSCPPTTSAWFGSTSGTRRDATSRRIGNWGWGSERLENSPLGEPNNKINNQQPL